MAKQQYIIRRAQSLYF